MLTILEQRSPYWESEISRNPWLTIHGHRSRLPVLRTSASIYISYAEYDHSCVLSAHQAAINKTRCWDCEFPEQKPLQCSDNCLLQFHLQSHDMGICFKYIKSLIFTMHRTHFKPLLWSNFTQRQKQQIRPYSSLLSPETWEVLAHLSEFFSEGFIHRQSDLQGQVLFKVNILLDISLWVWGISGYFPLPLF